MKIIKKGCFNLAATVVLLSLPVMAFAKPVTVTNVTKRPVSVVVNHHCASEFGNIKTFTSATVAERNVNILCGVNEGRCIIEVYNGISCQGRLIASFIYNSRVGLTGEGGAVLPYTLVLRYNTEATVGEP